MNDNNGNGNEAGGKDKLPAPTTDPVDAIDVHADSIKAEEMDVTAASEIRSAVVRQPTKNEKKRERGRWQRKRGRGRGRKKRGW